MVAERQVAQVEIADYQYGFHDTEDYVYKSERGLTREGVASISRMKNEPEWMLEFRLKAYDHYMKRPMPNWGSPVLAELDFENIFYYIKPAEKQGKTWDEVPEYIKTTFEKLGIPEAERKFLAGVGAQYESEVIYHSLREDLEKQGVIFLDMDSAVREHPEIVKKYFGTVIPANDNKFAALNSAVWSGGSFIYVPEGVKIEVPLQAYLCLQPRHQACRGLPERDDGVGRRQPRFQADDEISGRLADGRRRPRRDPLGRVRR